jgi:hypothetical protein
MKYALQIYGVFRTFETCLPHILNYLNYNRFDYDIFILSQRSDGYSLENENKIRQMLGQRFIQWKYIEDYPPYVSQEETALCDVYRQCVEEARHSIQSDLTTNGFVTRLWYRRWLNNVMRKDYSAVSGVVYDWVIRTRFDIGYRTVMKQQRLGLLDKYPEPNTIYMMPDILSCGSPQAIDYESGLIHQWPYLYRCYQQTGKYAGMPAVTHVINKWLFMSEMNLVQYMKTSPYKVIMLPFDFKITRHDMTIPKTQLGHDHILNVQYGSQDKWINVTERFIDLFATNFQIQSNGASLVVDNNLVSTDPKPGYVKNMVITTIENNEYIYREGQKYCFKYMHVYPLMESITTIKQALYGLGNQIIDVTKMVKSAHNGVLYVSNRLSEGKDPCSGVEKILTITMMNETIYEFCEYAIVLFLSR